MGGNVGDSGGVGETAGIMVWAHVVLTLVVKEQLHLPWGTVEENCPRDKGPLRFFAPRISLLV
jgi:hypothetical protein